MKPLIELHNVSKKFRVWEDRPTSLKSFLASLIRGHVQQGKIHHRQILDRISLTVGAGEFVGIMGRNGAGKSTLLKLIAGIYTPDSGTVKIHGRIAPLLELGAGFADDLSGYENIFLNAAILGFSRAATSQSLNSIIEFSELGDAIRMPVKKYSSGMLMRLGFSIACHLDAEILLFDEVLAVGDMGFQAKCLAKIAQLHGEGRAVVLITHSPEQVEHHCQRCIVIDQHRVVADGPAPQGAQVYRQIFG